jgi:hypothetical protein
MVAFDAYVFLDSLILILEGTIGGVSFLRRRNAWTNRRGLRRTALFWRSGQRWQLIVAVYIIR